VPPHTSALARQVRATIDRHELLPRGDTVVVGVSGGADSLCLLYLLRRLAPDYGVSLHVAHLHHGIRGQAADADAAFVRDLCAEWGLSCTIERVDVPALAEAHGLSTEEAARQARYGFVGRLARRVGGRTVAVAHHADDQVETVLMHFLRGSGLAGLRGMRPLSWLDELHMLDDDATPPVRGGRLRLVRPLLTVTQEEILAYCQTHGLTPRFDRTNLDVTYFRNRLRHELIPTLEAYNPNIRQVVLRTAEVLAGDYELLQGLVDEAWDRVVAVQSPGAIAYDLEALRDLPAGLQRSLLRRGIETLRHSLRNISLVHIDDARDVLMHGDVGAQATLPAGLMLQLDYARAILADVGYTPAPPDWPRVSGPVTVPVPGAITLPETPAWRVVTRLAPREALDDAWQDNPDRYTAYFDADRVEAPLLLRPRRTGDEMVPLGLDHHQRLTDLMINLKIPQAARDRVPLLVSDGEIIWVVGWRVGETAAVRRETRRVLVVRVERTDDRE
jgi:tRNA(Ile)-lysidine synthase